LKVKVLLFASLREIAGAGSIEVELPSGATVLDVLRKLAELLGDDFKQRLFREGGRFNDYLRVTVNRVYLRVPEELGREVCSGDEIAILPPASGG